MAAGERAQKRGVNAGASCARCQSSLEAAVEESPG